MSGGHGKASTSVVKDRTNLVNQGKSFDICKTRLFSEHHVICLDFFENFLNKVFKYSHACFLHCAYLCLLSHYGVHSVLKQCIEEIFRFISGWIKETLSKAITWCNQWSRVNFMPFLSNCVIIFIFSVIWKIYHGP